MKLPQKIVISHEPPETALERTLYTLANTTNEVIDYLSDKESLAKLTSPEFIKALKKENDIQYEINHPTLSDKEEASKGEKPVGCICPDWKYTILATCPVHGINAPIPPQQEESMGECDHCYSVMHNHHITNTNECIRCGEPQLKEIKKGEV